MCKRTYLYVLLGFLLVLITLGGGAYLGAQRLMVVETESHLNFNATVEAISVAARDQGWQVPKVYKLCKSLEKHGHKVPPVAVIELCKPNYAAELLSHDDTRMVSSFMPCRISVYEKADGSVIISRMNTSLISHLFGDEIASVMSAATQETQAILDQALLWQTIEQS